MIGWAGLLFLQRKISELVSKRESAWKLEIMKYERANNLGTCWDWVLRKPSLMRWGA